jgi:hypothetical protein
MMAPQLGHQGALLVRVESEAHLPRWVAGLLGSDHNRMSAS